MNQLKIGFIGLDTSHVSAFAKLLHDEKNPHYIPGGRVTVAFPGGSKDFPLSINRVEGFTKELREQHGVKIVDRCEAVAEVADMVFIESVDGRVHLEQFKRIVRYKKPTFIDKPFTVNLAEAREILRLASESGVPVMSCSSLRYAEALAKALAGGRKDVIGFDVFGPMGEEPTQPGLFWYGCHSVEMLVAALGAGCVEVRGYRNDRCDILTAIWADGRVGTFRGSRDAHSKFGGTLHRKEGPQFVDCTIGRPAYAGMIEAIIRSLPHGRSDVPAEEMLEVVKIIEAANRSRVSGEPVQL
jgi:predicted dehydrogenase